MKFSDSKNNRLSQNQFGIRRLRNAILVLSSALLVSSIPASADSLDSILVDMQGSSYAYVRDEASWEAENDSPAYSSAPSNTPAYETFTGTFTPTDANAALAIFSDDGCDVYINDKPVHLMKDKGQHLPDLAQSLHKIGFKFEVGKPYEIKVEYSNTIYSGGSDIDGVTLFAYTDNDEIPGPGPDPTSGARKWTPTRTNPATNQTEGAIQGEIIRPSASGQVQKGSKIELQAIATDLDYWTQTSPLSKSGNERDSLLYPKWTAKFADGKPVSGLQRSMGITTWTVPSNLPAGTKVTLTVTIDDTPRAIPASDDPASNRDDAAWSGSVEVEVVDTPTIVSIGVKPQNPHTSGENNTPAASIDFTAEVQDASNLIEKVEWRCEGLGNSTSSGKDLSWQLTPVPFDAEHKDYTVECTIFWKGGQKTATKNFKLFFSKYSFDESSDVSRGVNGQNPPNWFDNRPKHWGNVVPGLKDTYYSYSIGGGATNSGIFIYKRNIGYKQGNTNTDLPPGSIVITDYASNSISASNDYPNVKDTFVGIDAVAAIVRHEMRHKWQLEQSWGGYDQAHIGMNGIWVGNRSFSYDRDGDHIKDDWEFTQWGQKITEPDEHYLTKKAGLPLQADNEYDADINGTNTWIIGTLDSQDWSDTGKQSDYSY